jgi:hypothetical protein
MDLMFGFQSQKNKGKFLDLEMDQLRRSARVSRLQNISDASIRNKMQAE